MKYLLFILTGSLFIGCSYHGKETTFLNLTIGMDEAAARDSIRSLVANDLIQQDLNEFIYVFNEHDPDRKVHADFNVSYDYGVLVSITLSLGYLERYSSGGYFVGSCITKKEVSYVYDLYKLKYGDPDDECKDCINYWYIKDDLQIGFSKGYKNPKTCSYLLMGAAIYYEIPESVLNKMKLNEELNEKSRELDNI